jgi:hypothetical protein
MRRLQKREKDGALMVTLPRNDRSFDYLVGEREQLIRHVHAERLSDFEVDHAVV